MRRDALQNAVAVIAANLDAQDISCPVCLHEWVPPGTLLSKAQRAAATDPVLLRAEESAKEANARLDQLRGALEAIEVRLKDAGSHSNRQTAILSSLESEVQRCLDHSLLGGGQELEELDRVVEEEASRLAAEESSWQDSPESGLPPAADQVAALKLSQESLEAGQRRLGEASRGLEVAQETNAELDARSGVLLDLLHEIDPSFDRTEDERTEYEHRRLRSEQRLKEIRGKIATAKERLSKATERINECRESLARATAKKESLATRRSALAGQWTSAGLTLPVSAQILEKEIAGVSERRRQRSRRLERLEVIGAALTAWIEGQDADQIRRRLEVAAGGASGEEFSRHESLLREKVEREKMLLSSVRKTRAVVGRLEQRIGDHTSELRHGLVAALNEPLGRLLPALVIDRRFQDLELSVAGSAQRGEVGTPLTEGIGGSQADYFLSEGQMAGVSLAILMAMATTFRWSRWPALLLDDPAQNNDLIHTASLLDVLRTLVISEGFQVFLSTHDRELGEYIQRKCRNARIKGSLLRFREASEEKGVVPSVSSWGEEWTS